MLLLLKLIINGSDSKFDEFTLAIICYIYYSVDMKPHKDVDYGVLVNASWTGMRGELQRNVKSNSLFKDKHMRNRRWI